MSFAVCHAVQHAHQKGVIHRDIKPSNVMVTLHGGNPVPKVIDFGIAKATDHWLAEKTLFTEYRQLVGTPAYMSPEQAEMSGLDVDTRTDIYSLGVLLYELLTGTTPFDAEKLRRAAYGEIQRIIREVEPPRPSTRLSTLGVDQLTGVAKEQPSSSIEAASQSDSSWSVALRRRRIRRAKIAGRTHPYKVHAIAGAQRTVGFAPTVPLRLSTTRVPAMASHLINGVTIRPTYGDSNTKVLPLRSNGSQE
jgi:serine/threonine protein kinase